MHFFLIFLVGLSFSLTGTTLQSADINFLRAKAEGGNPDAQLDLGLKYQDGQGVAKDEGEAIKWITKAAEQGNPMAQLTLGELYLYGRGTPKDETKSIGWLEKAAGYDTRPRWPWRSLAFALLGNAYERGKGIQNPAKAIEWYRKAAMLNDPRGQLPLAEMYSVGEGVAKDEIEGLAWVYVAADSGEPGTQNNSGIKLEAASLEEKVGEKGISLARKRSKELALEISDSMK